ncbi:MULTISPECIES: prepilin-type N-terminal cleavage/methylation domain-containing protein [unclassified Neptuniibacter]|uniref:prepilin-type N-terminal cleavage/methylation domain-containing protein n=1 Tax=unclassified Neptuniibacter TaxID=2630693 RepID=UPI0025CE61F5|nr:MULTISPECIES: prepilin-type N-terminal cleavage/methylation domain-containing protein [unclassified Neptuniibacter]|tara:strand:- start:5148 stop:6023 length:876 start_codon:yes stop_codon:yes gene_type:complete
MSLANKHNAFLKRSVQLNTDCFPKSVRDAAFRKAVFRYQGGFTLLEMIVVAALLLVVAGGVVTSFRDVGSDASEQAARFQMQQLGEAIEAYYADNDTIPTRTTPADLSFLFTKPASAADWNMDYRRGWRGPYLSGHKYLYVDIGDDLTVNGRSEDDSSIHGEPNLIAAGGDVIESVVAIADPFYHYPVDDGVNRSTDGCNTADCLFEWRKTKDDDSTLLTRFGRPYLAIDLENLQDSSIVPGAARLVSLGSNGIYEPNDCDYTEIDDSDPDFCHQDLLCSSSGDDIVLCLR